MTDKERVNASLTVANEDLRIAQQLLARSVELVGDAMRVAERDLQDEETANTIKGWHILLFRVENMVRSVNESITGRKRL